MNSPFGWFGRLGHPPVFPEDIESTVAIGSILLAAGAGTRLRPLTDAVPKPALPVLDVPLASWGLASLMKGGIETVVNASHLSGELERRLRVAFPDGWELLDEGPVGFGTAGTVAALADRVDERVLVHNGDLITDLDPGDVIETHLAIGAGITLAVRTIDGGGDFEIAGHEVKGFVDRRRDPNAGNAQYLGIAVIEREVAVRISKTRPLGLGESVLAPLAKRGWLAVHVHRGYALDVGTIDRYVKANIDCLNGVAPAPPLQPPGEVIEVAGGRAYVGPKASADPGTLGPGAVVLLGAKVAEGAHVERAVVFEREVVTPGHDVRDCVWIDDRAVTGVSSPPAR